MKTIKNAIHEKSLWGVVKAMLSNPWLAAAVVAAIVAAGIIIAAQTEKNIQSENEYAEALTKSADAAKKRADKTAE
jgi:hypothetical protein